MGRYCRSLGGIGIGSILRALIGISRRNFFGSGSVRERSFNSDLGDEKFGVRGSLSISLLNSFCWTDRFLVHLSVNKFLCPFLRRDGEGVLKKSELSLDVFMLQLIFSILRQEIPVSEKYWLNQ